MNRALAAAATCAAICFAAPAQAVFLSFDVNATGTGQEFTLVPGGSPAPPGSTCLPGPPPSLCVVTTALSRQFSFAQDFQFTGGVLLYDVGDQATTGRTRFTLTQGGGGLYSLTNFNFFRDTRVVAPGPGITEALIAPGQVIAPVPEPATWMTMIAGFGLLGGMLRSRRRCGARVAFG